MKLIPPIRAKVPTRLEEIYQCKMCSLSEKSYPIRPRGNFKARTMLLGEAPGKVEEEDNIFFIGPAGKLLEEATESLGLYLDRDFFVMNTVQCRPHPPEGARKENRAPTPEEISVCRPNLDKIIEAHQPDLIVVIGGVAAKAIMTETPRSVGAIVGKFSGPNSHTLNCNADLYSVWHPAYILRNQEKKKDWMFSLVQLRDYMKGRNLVIEEE